MNNSINSTINSTTVGELADATSLSQVLVENLMKSFKIVFFFSKISFN